MQSFSPGLSDSIASVITDAPPCPRCDSSSHVAGGLCVGCLLQSGLSPDDECAPEALISALAEINLPDQNWRLGNYEILEEIGRGGMGVIYRARQRHSRRIVAVKRVLSYHSDSRETLARFRREAQAAASLDHPNILPIYEVSESEDGLPFFSMKFAPGGNLQEVGPALRSDPRQCVALVAKVARAVQYAHAKGILHRDLKPGNILLDARGEPLVSDFGLAKWLDATSELTRTLTIFGTPGYIAPEQANGPAADLKPTADVYSLGAILFDLLAGRPPFLGAHALSVIRQAAELPAPKLRTLSKIADRDLETICAHCLEREPSARYPSAHDLAEDLERWLEGRPIIARRAFPPARLWRWSKRNPILSAAISGFVVLSVVACFQFRTTTRLGATVRNESLARRTIAIIPFEDLDSLSLSSSAAQELTDQMTQSLVSAKTLRFTSAPQIERKDQAGWTSVDLRRFGQSVGARLILSGTVRTRESKQRIAVHVTDVSSGETALNHIVELKANNHALKQLAHSTILDLENALSGYPGKRNSSSEELRSKDMIAQQNFDAGREYYFRYRPADNEMALQYFEKAFEADPTFTSAHAMFALAAITHARQSKDATTWMMKAEAAAAKAIALNPQIPTAHRAQSVCAMYRGRFTDAIESALIAIELDPSDTLAPSTLAYSLRQIGRPDLAVRWYHRCAARAPRPGLYSAPLGDCFYGLADDANAEQAYAEAAEFCPDLPDGGIGLAHLRLIQGNFDAARQMANEALTSFPQHPYPLQLLAQTALFTRNFAEAEKLYRELLKSDPDGGAAFYGAINFQSALGRLRIAAGDELNGRVILERTLDKELQILEPGRHHPDSLYRIAALESSLGRSDDAFSHLRDAVRSGWIDYRSMDLDPRFDLLRNDPRYRELFEAMRTQVAILRRSMPAEKTGQNTTK